MRKLIVIGEGGFGKEVTCWAKQCKEYGSEWLLEDYIDIGSEKRENSFQSDEVLDKIEKYKPLSDFVFSVAVQSPKIKLQIADNFISKGVTFINLIHPTTVIGEDVNLGIGCILCPYVVLSSNLMINNFVIFNTYSYASYDSEIGDGCTINPHCGVMISAKLGKGVFMGSSSIVFPRKSVGNFAFIGAGSVVLNNVKENEKVFGVPARRI